MEHEPIVATPALGHSMEVSWSALQMAGARQTRISPSFDLKVTVAGHSFARSPRDARCPSVAEDRSKRTCDRWLNRGRRHVVQRQSGIVSSFLVRVPCAPAPCPRSSR